jgi:putative addiction module killer protein
MIELRQTAEFAAWLRRLKDNNAAARIVARLRRLEQGNPGDAKSVGGGIMEIRIDYGAGYRVYYASDVERKRSTCFAPGTSGPRQRTSSAPKDWQGSYDDENNAI